MEVHFGLSRFKQDGRHEPARGQQIAPRHTCRRGEEAKEEHERSTWRLGCGARAASTKHAGKAPPYSRTQAEHASPSWSWSTSWGSRQATEQQQRARHGLLLLRLQLRHATQRG